MTQTAVVTHYLRLAVVPSPLVLDYEWPAAALGTEVALPALVVASLVGATTFGLVRRSPGAFAGAWFFLILAPTSSVVPIVTEAAAEHRMYLPLAGIIALTVLGGFRVLSRVAARAKWAFRGGLLGAGLVIALFGRMTYDRNTDYGDFDRIWTDTITKRPDNARARNNYATSLLTQGRFAEAERHLQAAVARKPSFVEAQANLGIALSAQGRLDEGIDHLQRAIALRPDYASAHRNLGEAYAMQGRLGLAAGEYLRALDLMPSDVPLLNRASWILATSPDAAVRDGGRARALAERAVRLTSEHDAESLDSLAAAFAEQGSFEAARQAARHALAEAHLMADSDLVQQIEFRLKTYEQDRAFRDAAR